MAAELKLFLDSSCTQELEKTEDGNYVVTMPDNNGINGTFGSTFYYTIYVKNVGTRAALHTSVYMNNEDSFVTLVTPEDGFIGDMKELEITSIRLKVAVRRWTAIQVVSIPIVFDFYTLPDIDEVYHNPYQDVREVAE